MKLLRILFLLPVLFPLFSSHANPAPEPQILNPVKWSWKYESLGKGEYKLIFIAKIDVGWHTYSQTITGDGPFPTTLTFDKENKDVKLIGAAIESGSKPHSGHDPVFDINLTYYDRDMTLVQKVKLLKDTKLKGTLEYMACDDKQCLPPEPVEFEFDLKGAASTPSNPEPVKPKTQGTLPNSDEAVFNSAVQAVIETEMKKDSTAQATVVLSAAENNKYGQPVQECSAESGVKDKSLFAIIIFGFLGGLAAFVTPCVFPMIPLTVSFFTKRSENKKRGKFDAVFYAFCIVFIYFLLAVPFLIFNISSDTIYEISSGIPLNVFFFIIFVIFAFSFFGYYEIQLPSFIANKADSASSIGGLIGIFFMALTLAIVSFSCTGPIVGSLLVGALSSSSGKLNLIAGMTSFGFALALPFGLFAFFPKLMYALPKSGGWLNTVKVVLGFLELIFAVKFLSNADLVGQWGLLKREVFLGLWALLGAAMFLYLIGKIKFPHDSPVGKLAPVRAGAALLALLFTGYSSYGIPGNDLSLFSGFPPPKSYSWFQPPLEIEPIKNNYEAALARARAENKPLMIDFTGYTCVNCRKMEENVWPVPEVKEKLAEKFVIVSLYADDPTELPLAEQRISEYWKGKNVTKKIKTLGNKFNEMQAQYFGKNSQPFYVLITPDEKLLNNPVAYTPNAKEYTAWLDCGLNAFEEYRNN